MPRGGTAIEPGNTVLVLADRDDLSSVRAILKKLAERATTDRAG